MGKRGQLWNWIKAGNNVNEITWDQERDIWWVWKRFELYEEKAEGIAS